MGKSRRVAVCGNSIHIAGIVATLKADTTLDVLRLNFDSPNVLQSLEENNLAAIVFDVNDPPLRLVVSLLCNRPGLLLIGVDASSDQILVLSNHPAQARSMADLISVIHHRKITSSSVHKENHEMNQP